MNYHKFMCRFNTFRIHSYSFISISMISFDLMWGPCGAVTWISHPSTVLRKVTWSWVEWKKRTEKRPWKTLLF